MKVFAGIVFAVLVCNQANAQKQELQCPPRQPTFGICTFDPNVNCLDDSACQGGQICCPSGCNKVCTNPNQAQEQDQQQPANPGMEVKQCPPSSGSFGICSFDEEKNCLEDSQCTNGQMCCSEGCNKVCKDPVTFQPIKPQPKGTGRR